MQNLKGAAADIIMRTRPGIFLLEIEYHTPVKYIMA